MQVQFQPGLTARNTTSTPTDGGAVSDFDSFLRLLTAQLRNQDPLSPLDSTQFVSQLANFSTVEQLVSANARLEEIGARIVGDSVADFAHLIGRTVELTGQPARFDGAPIKVGIEAPAGAISAELIVRTADGAIAERVPVPATSGIFEWHAAGAQAGQLYFFETAFAFSNGTLATFEAATIAGIRAVRRTDSEIVLDLDNGLSASTAQIRSVRL